MKAIIGGILISTLVLAASARADTPDERATLRGITAVRVIVDNPGRDVEPFGVSQAALRADVESRLKRAGITLLGPNERAQGMPYLHLGVSIFPAGEPSDELFIYSIDLVLYQEVRLIRLPGVRASSPTWKAIGTIGTLKADNLATLRDIAGQYAASFVSAHQAANPK